jgi:hypothetical protein
MLPVELPGVVEPLLIEPVLDVDRCERPCLVVDVPGEPIVEPLLIELSGMVDAPVEPGMVDVPVEPPGGGDIPPELALPDPFI